MIRHEPDAAAKLAFLHHTIFGEDFDRLTWQQIAAKGPNFKIAAIKKLRSTDPTCSGLKEAKDLVDGAPKSVKEGVSKEDAAAIKAKLDEVGATVEIK